MKLHRVMACAAAFAMMQAHAITVTDDSGASVTLAKPAERVVSFAPHVTELLFAAGGGARIVGAVTYSDYPKAAQSIARVGDNKALDLERIVALHLDLIVVWRHGNAARQMDRRRRSASQSTRASRSVSTISRRDRQTGRAARHAVERAPRPSRSRATSRNCVRPMRKDRP